MLVLHKYYDVTINTVITKTLTSITHQPFVQLGPRKASVQSTKKATDIKEDGITDCRSMNYLVYTCDKKCGGLADRQKGMVGAYLLALLTDRKFVIDMTYPCEMEQFWIPNEYNWLECKEYALSVPDNEVEEFRWFGKIQRKFMNNMNPYTVFQKKVVKLEINWYVYAYIQKTLLKKKNVPELQWLVGATGEEIMTKMLKYLFRTVDRSNEEIRNFYAQHVQHRQLVCGHIRYGMNHTDANFDRTRKGRANSSIILSYIKEHYSDTSKYTVYIAADLDVIRAQAAKELPNYVNFNKTIVHVDKLGLSHDEGCEGFYFAVLEQDVLSMCDVLIISKSAYSQMAVYRREKEGNLYYYKVETKEVVPIDRKDIFNTWKAGV